MGRAYHRSHNMPKSFPTNITTRDLHLLAAIDRVPLTPAQLFTISQTFDAPFTDVDNLRRRLRRLTDSGLIQSWPYAIATDGRSPRYFKLTREGYRLVHGPDAVLPKRRHFEVIAPGHHHHTLALADVVVRLTTLASKHGVQLEQFSREGTVRVEVGSFTVFPDATFQLRMSDGRVLNFFVELDRGTERVRSKADIESIERKLRAYDLFNARYDARDNSRPLVLFITTRSSVRVDNILAATQAVMANSKRAVFLATSLEEFLARDTFTEAVFRDNRGLLRRLLPIPLVKALATDRRTDFHAKPFPSPAAIGVV